MVWHSENGYFCLISCDILQHVTVSGDVKDSKICPASAASDDSRFPFGGPSRSCELRNRFVGKCTGQDMGSRIVLISCAGISRASFASASIHRRRKVPNFVGRGMMDSIERNRRVLKFQVWDWWKEAPLEARDTQTTSCRFPKPLPSFLSNHQCEYLIWSYFQTQPQMSRATLSILTGNNRKVANLDSV